MCAVETCDRPTWARGYCRAHYERQRLYGDVRAEIPIRTWHLKGRSSDPCKVSGCQRQRSAHGYCAPHLLRWRKHGDPLAGKPFKRPHGNGYISRDGYRHIWIDGEQRLEHRVVMERLMGRRLLREEIVHHRNGERADNRPENLELWLRSHPPGQRVEEVVEWALAIVERYRPAVLR